MSGQQYSNGYASRNRNSTQFQTANPYAALVATAGSEHDRRSSSSGSPPSSGSLNSSTTQQHYRNTPSRTGYAARAANRDAIRTGGHPSANSLNTSRAVLSPCQASSLAGVPESVAVQEMAFRQGQRDSASAFDEVPANPFAQQFNQLWAAYYKLGKECGGQRAPTPVNPSQQNFAWTILINPYTQSLKNPNGSLDPAWTRKMITVALDCMHELVRITCRRNNGWEKTVADIPLPAQEALAAFPDLAQEYEQLKRDAQEARAGGRPYGY